MNVSTMELPNSKAKLHQGLVTLVCKVGTLTYSSPFVVHNMGVTLVLDQAPGPHELGTWVSPKA